jgi:hypothetical protein
MTARLSDLPHRQFEHLVVFVDDVEVAGGVHRPPRWGEWRPGQPALNRRPI